MLSRICTSLAGRACEYVFLGEETLKSSMASEYIKQVNALLDREMQKTISIIEEGKDTIQRIVDELVSHNHLTGTEFAELMEIKIG